MFSSLTSRVTDRVHHPLAEQLTINAFATQSVQLVSVSVASVNTLYSPLVQNTIVWDN
jgi:hypothetical protein